MNKNDLKRKIAALIAPAIISSSVATLPVNAMSEKETETIVNTMVFSSANFMENEGLAAVKVDNSYVYVDLDNNKLNTYKYYEEALKDAYSIYGNNYNIFYKDVYVNGRRVVIYATTDKTQVSGWNKTGIAVLSNYDKIASTIEYGEFLAKNIDLSSYKKNMKGFAYLNLGTSKEIVYIGNNENNELLDKYNITEYTKNSNYYFFKKNVVDYKGRTQTLYAINRNSQVNGWTRINLSSLKDSDFVATNMTLSDVSFDIYNKVQKAKLNVNTNNISYNSKLKADALDYAYNNIDSFCLLTKTVNNKAIYAISKVHYIEGWSMIANDFIPNDAQIFMSVEDADKYTAKTLNSKEYSSYNEFYNLVNNYTYTNESRYYNYDYDYNYYKNYYPDYRGNEVQKTVDSTYLPNYNTTVESMTPNYETNNNKITNNPNSVNQNANIADYKAVLRDQALVYGENNYKEFYILAKSVDDVVIYTLSTDYQVSGWTLVGNDNIPSNAYVFKNMTDANNYINALNNGYSRTLR